MALAVNWVVKPQHKQTKFKVENVSGGELIL